MPTRTRIIIVGLLILGAVLVAWIIISKSMSKATTNATPPSTCWQLDTKDKCTSQAAKCSWCDTAGGYCVANTVGCYDQVLVDCSSKKQQSACDKANDCTWCQNDSKCVHIKDFDAQCKNECNTIKDKTECIVAFSGRGCQWCDQSCKPRTAKQLCAGPTQANPTPSATTSETPQNTNQPNRQCTDGDFDEASNTTNVLENLDRCREANVHIEYKLKPNVSCSGSKESVTKQAWRVCPGQCTDIYQNHDDAWIQDVDADTYIRGVCNKVCKSIKLSYTHSSSAYSGNICKCCLVTS